MKVTQLSVEIFIFLAFAVFSIFITFSGRVNPFFKLFVSCEDERYKRPLLPVEQHLVPFTWLYVAALIVLPVLFLIVDMILLAGFPKSRIEGGRDKLRKAIGDCCNVLALYYCGIFFLMILCKGAQFIGGSPSPYFLAMCAPGCSNMTASYIHEATKRVYVTEESCPENELRQDSLSSFPCVHAVLSFYAASFITVLYCSRGRISYSRLLQPSIAILTICLAFVASLSRLHEYSNHTVDVIGGGIIGVALGCLQVFVVGQKIPDHKKRE